MATEQNRFGFLRDRAICERIDGVSPFLLGSGQVRCRDTHHHLSHSGLAEHSVGSRGCPQLRYLTFWACTAVRPNGTELQPLSLALLTCILT